MLRKRQSNNSRYTPITLHHINKSSITLRSYTTDGYNKSGIYEHSIVPFFTQRINKTHRRNRIKNHFCFYFIRCIKKRKRTNVLLTSFIFCCAPIVMSVFYCFIYFILFFSHLLLLTYCSGSHNLVSVREVARKNMRFCFFFFKLRMRNKLHDPLFIIAQ